MLTYIVASTTVAALGYLVSHLVGWPLPASVFIAANLGSIGLEIAKRFWRGRDRAYVNEQLRRRYGTGRNGRE